MASVLNDGVASTNLTALAARLGVLDDYQSHISRCRHERAAWHAYLAPWSKPIPTPLDLEEEEKDEYWLPPPDAKVWRAA